jgi:tetratricopeptide (TPR) repeat protein
MRVAIVIAPPAADVPPAIALLRERLVLAGFNVVNLATTASLGAQLKDAASLAGPDDEVLVYLAAKARLDDDGVPRLATSGEDVPASSLRDAVAARQVLHFVEVQHDGLADDVMRAAEHVDALATALGVRESGQSLLIGAHGDDAAQEAWPLTRFYLEAVAEEDAREGRGDLSASRFYERVRASSELAARVPSYALLKGAADFVMDPLRVPPPTPSRRPPVASVPPPSSEPHRSLRPIVLPALDPILLAAAEAREKSQWERALEEYKKALFVVGAEDRAAKASIYGYIGEVKRAQGKTREAELNFEKALREDPKHRRSLEVLVAIAVDDKDWTRVVAHRRALSRALTSPERRAEELIKAAQVCEKELADLKEAARILEEAREHTPQDLGLLQKLRALYEATREWGKVEDALGAMCEVETAAPQARAELRFQQADIVLARLRDDVRGCALLERALEEDPAHERALHALASVRARREEHAAIEPVLLRAAERLGARGDFARASEVCKRLAVLRRDRLNDGPGAVEAYRTALACKPSDADARALLAELLVARGDKDGAARELEIASTHVPTRAATYKRLFELHTRAARTDQAWLCATALVALGAAEMDHDLAVDQMKSTTSTLRPQASLDDEAWRKLAAPGVDEEVGAVLEALLPAAVAMRVEELRGKKKLVELDPQKKQPKTSTVSAVRTFLWASQVLGVEPPELYVLPEVPGGLAAVQAQAPQTAIGLEVTSGMSVPALAFLAARHLTYYRRSHYALVFYPTIADLSALVLSAIKLARPKLAASKPIAQAAKRLGKELDRLGEGARAKLDTAVVRLESRGSKLDLAAFARGVELTAQRAGLLLAGDLKLALSIVDGEERAVADVSSADRRGELLASCASSAFSELRARLGVAARGGG